jgi:methyl-accepting chemotaxis protein
MIKNIVSSAHAIAKGYLNKVKNKELTIEEAKKLAKDAINEIRYENDNNYVFIYNYDGVGVAVPLNSKNNGVNNLELKDKNGVYLIKDLIQAGKNGGGFVNYVWTAGSKKNAPKLSYALGIDEWNWMIGSGIYIDDVEKVNVELRNTILAYFIGILIIGLFFAFMIGKRIIGRINLIKNIMADIAEGDGDLTVKLPDDSNDELGVLSKKFNIFINKLHSMISDLSEQSQVLSAASEELQVTSLNMTESLDGASNEIKETNNIVDVVNNKTKETANATIEADKNISNISSNANEIQLYYQKLEENSNQLEEKVLSITTAVDEMNVTIGEITKNTTIAASISHDADEKAKITKGIMQELNKMANDINDIVDLIKDISSQTNLLALNATIEAASAGEAGKGFAVVANEIKNLANQTAEATKKINNQINAVQERTKESVKHIENIGVVITSLNEINLTIASTLEEQSVTINEISNDMNVTATTTSNTVENVHIVGEKMQKVTTGIGLTNNNINSISKETDYISSQMNTINNRVSTLNTLVNDNLSGAKDVNTSAIELSRMSEHLNQVIKMFVL